MNIASDPYTALRNAAVSPQSATNSNSGDTDPMRAQFDKTVSTIFYTQMMKALRSTGGKTAYMNGGMGEDLFQGQLDQVVVDTLASRQPNPLTGSLYQRFDAGLKATKPVIADSFAGSTPSATSPNPATTTEASKSLQTEIEDSLANLSQLSRRAQSASEALPVATGTTAIPMLVRK